MDTQLKSHVYYEYFRSYFAGATDSLKDRIDDLKSISHGGAVDESFLHELLENSTEEVRLEKLGDLFRKQLCEYHWALELYRKALEIYKKILGEDHLDVANTYNNIANVMESHGKLEDAMELYRKALKIKKKTLGEEHWSVASTSNNMANVESQSKEEKEEFQAGSYDSMILMQTSMSMETRKQVTGIYSATMISSARKEQRKGTCLEVSLKGAAAKHDRPPIASRPILQRRYP